MTQNEMVMNHLELYDTGLTAGEAMRLYGIGRLGARVKELRDRGVPIDKVMEHAKNGGGYHTAWARYYLKRPEP